MATTRADNHDGSCVRVVSGKHAGRWRVQFVHEDDLGRKKRLSRLFPNKSEAKTFLQACRRGERESIAVRTGDLTLEEWYVWLAANDWPEALDPKTVAARLSRYRTYAAPVFGHVPLSRIDPIRVRAFYQELRATGVGDATVRQLKAHLVRAFNQAITPYGRLPMSHANPFGLTLQGGELRTAVALTPDEAWEAIRHPMLTLGERSFLATLLLAGLRLGEVSALTRDQVLLDKGTLLIDRAVKLGVSGEQSVGLPKGDKVRVAVLSPTLATIIHEQISAVKTVHVWPGEGKDQPRMRQSIYRTWRTILKKTGLPGSMSPHDCRLTHINWIEKLLPLVSPTTLKEHVGHSSGRSVTEVNYTRPLTPAQDLLRDGLEGMIDET